MQHGIQLSRKTPALSVLGLFLLLACTSAPAGQGASPKPLPPLTRWPQTTFAVIADPHIFPASFAVGPEYERYVAQDPKLLRESQEIFEALLEQLVAERVDFVILAGDLTKDGERDSHLWLALKLDELRAAGIRAYVTTGNHDLNNPEAYRFTPSGRERVPTVGPQEFAFLYANHGFGDSLERDPASLSYLAEPVPGLWLLALDSSLYEDNLRRSKSVTGGELRPGTLLWMERILRRAQEENKAVIAMLHHPPAEQFRGRSRYMPDFLLKNHREVMRLWSGYGVQLVFSGHTHSQDITVVRTGVHPVYSVVTGSPVSYPNSWRLVRLGPEGVMIQTRYVTSLPSREDFGTFSKDFAREKVTSLVSSTLRRFWVGQDEVALLAPQVSAAFLAFWAGDESFSGPGERITRRGLWPPAALVVSLIGDMVEAMWEDQEPPDNQLFILPDGRWEPAP